MFLDFMPYLQGISKNFSPRDIVTGRSIDFNKHYKAQLGSYVEAHDDIVVTNTQHIRTFPEIYFIPTGNIQGTLK